MMAKKNFKAVLYINWKTGAMRIFKRKPRHTSPWEVGINLDIDIEMPDLKSHLLKGTIIIHDMIIESIWV
jgi:hypothetical protein